MDFTKIMVALVMFFIMIAGGFLFITNNLETGNLEASSEMSNNTDLLDILQNQINDTFNTSQNMFKDVTAEDTEKSDFDIIGGFIKGGYRAIVQFISMFSVFGNIVQSIAIFLHIPNFVVTAISVLILASIAITMIYMMFRFQPR